MGRWAVALVAVSLVAGCATSQSQQAIAAAEAAAQTALVAAESSNETAPRANGSSMGVLCWAGILESISDTGKRCVAKEDPQFRSALNSSIARLDAHLTTTGGWSPAQLSRFKAQMGGQGAPDAEVCGNSDASQMYQGLQKSGTAPLEQQTSAVLANPGPPKWGDCL